MTKTYTETITLQEETCASCGITFAVPSHWLKNKQSTGEGFCCPNGDRLSFAKGTETMLREKLQSEQERYRQLELQLTNAQDQLQATTQELQKHKKRVANGVCPCCNRSFTQLQRHMKTKHPEYGPVQEEK
jgi:hypothetical protein